MATKPEFLVAKKKNNVSHIGNCISRSPSRIIEVCVVILHFYSFLTGASQTLATFTHHQHKSQQHGSHLQP